jgi:hypothetical protein
VLKRSFRKDLVGDGFVEVFETNLRQGHLTRTAVRVAGRNKTERPAVSPGHRLLDRQVVDALDGDDGARFSSSSPSPICGASHRRW